MLNTVFEHGLELIAVALALAYLLLAVRQHIACWYAAFVSTAIYFFIFLDVGLYMQSALQVYYLGMALYGFYVWRNNGQDSALPISTWHWQQHGIAIALIVALTLASTLALREWSDAQLPLLDSFTTWGAIVTTFMVARKILENWLYWIVVDSVSLYLYLDRALWLTAALFGIYLIIVIFGWFSWQQQYRRQMQG